jgi:hypothetical protein
MFILMYSRRLGGTEYDFEVSVCGVDEHWSDMLRVEPTWMEFL